MSSEDTPRPQRYGLPKLRTAALERLGRAYADDDLELEDYERRIEAVQAAESVQEIADIMHDVPDFDATGSRSPATAPGGQPAGDVSPGSPTALGAGAHGPTEVQVLGDRTLDLSDFRNGAVRVVALLGDTRIDVSQLRPGETVVVTDYGALGDFSIRVPAGTDVVNHRVVVLGDVKRGPAKSSASRRGRGWRIAKRGTTADHRREPVPSPPPRVILQGFRLLGDTRIIEV